MLVSCHAWRSSVFLFALVFLGRAQLSAAECNSSVGGQSVSNLVPLCALACVEDFIRTEYTGGGCCDGTEIDCLCQTNSTNGLTLGEAALACTVGSCSTAIISANGTDAYEICNGVSGALPETHSAITATRVATITQTTHPASAATTTAVSGTGISTFSSSTAIATSTHATSASSTATSTAQTTSTTPTTMTTSTTSTGTTSTTASATASSQPSSNLSSPAVIGISIASGVSAIFLVAVAMFFCGRRLRRRKLEAQERDTFEIGGEMSEPPDFTAAATRGPPEPPIQPLPGNGQYGAIIGPNFQQFPAQPIARQGPLVILTQPGQNFNLKQYGMSPETEYEGSPESQTSQRTLSRLLPDRAVYGMFPEPLRIIRQPAPPRPTSEATVFDEDEQPSSKFFGPPLVRPQLVDVVNTADSRQNDHGGPVRVIGLPAGPRSMISAAMQRQEQSPYGPTGYTSYKWDKSPAPIPTASRNENRNDGSVSTGDTLPSSGISGFSSKPHYGNSNGSATSNTPISRNFSRLGRGPRSLTTPTETSAQQGFEAAPIAAADSSYETIVVNDDDWAERSKYSIPLQLTPVPEKTPTEDKFLVPPKSPLRNTAMPRSAAIVPAARVPRRSQAAEMYYENTRIGGPVQNQGQRQSGGTRNMAPADSQTATTQESNDDTHDNATFFIDSSSRSRSSSPSSLLAKRRGETVADKMETQFRSGVQPKVTASASRGRWKVVRGEQSSPTRAVPFVESKAARTPDSINEGVLSPKKHNITPTRRGQDLYLTVD